MNIIKRSLVAIGLLIFALNSLAQDKREIKNIAFFLQENAEILDFAGPMEVLVIAGYNVYTVAETQKPISAMHALKVLPDYTIANAPTPDIVVFVGGGDLATAKKR